VGSTVLCIELLVGGIVLSIELPSFRELVLNIGLLVGGIVLSIELPVGSSIEYRASCVISA